LGSSGAPSAVAGGIVDISTDPGVRLVSVLAGMSKLTLPIPGVPLPGAFGARGPLGMPASDLL
jgi:hypothetical protein